MDIKVADRIRHFQTSSADTNSELPVDLPPMALPDKEQLIREWAESASISIISPTVISTKRAWEAEDSMKREDFLRKMDKCPKKRKTEDAFDEEKSLNDILTSDRCVSKEKDRHKR